MSRQHDRDFQREHMVVWSRVYRCFVRKRLIYNDINGGIGFAEYERIS